MLVVMFKSTTVPLIVVTSNTYVLALATPGTARAPAIAAEASQVLIITLTPEKFQRERSCSRGRGYRRSLSSF